MPIKTELVKLLTCFLLLCLSSSLFAQKKDPLSLILPVLENRFHVKFSYSDADIAPYRVITPNLSEQLPLILSKIEAQTALVFEKLDERYYVITRKGGEVCISLKDATTGEPVSGATVEVIGSTRATVTDSLGNFHFPNVPSDAVLHLRSMGYKTIDLPVAGWMGMPCKSLLFHPEYQRLDEVVVQQYLTTGLQKKMDGSVSISTEKFGILPGLAEPDILHTIQALPGVESINETVSNINIRGGSHDQNLILWDGIKMYQSGHFFGLISAFNPYLTRDVSVIKNGTSAQYGDGVSGTIDMHSENTVNDSFTGGAGFNLISVDAFARIPLNKKLAVHLSARRSATDFISSPTYNSYFQRVFQDSKITDIHNQEVSEDIEREEDFFFYDTSLKVLYDPNEKHKIRANATLFNNSLLYNESTVSTSESKESSLDQQNLAFGGSIESQWSDRFTSLLTGYYTRYDLDAVNYTLFTDQRLLLNNEVLESGVKLHTNYRLSNALNVSNGYQFYEVGITNTDDINIPRFRTKQKDVIRNHALFSEVNYQSPEQKTFIRAGVRLNYIGKFDKFIVEPRLNIRQKLSRYIAVEFQGETRSQVTNQVIDLQRDFLGVEKRRWILANNSDLPVTMSKQISLGINYNKRSFYTGLEGFYKTVDGITTSGQEFQNQGQFLRTSGNYTSKGLEFLINKKAGKYSTWLSYTYAINDYEFGDLDPSRFPNNLDIRHSVSFAGTYIMKNLKLALGLNWHTGKPYTRPREGNEVTERKTGNTINYNSSNSDRLPEFIRADLSSTYNFSISEKVRATLGIAILNVLNKENTLDIYYRLENDQSTEVQQVENLSLGITPNMTFRVFF
ncbi:TonB-dependent receptor [Sinomicrobium weinanense]|uniref:TonB-dependent receptor plug domain-containing protein n=1 Tax=Sinomicrobium weinanense TaxID=2842200 RepID=A0A926JQQ6_9FLAO|nr:carboxypeptidase-like regulatory domain-containing protein [Sinomicrobium weinanense]MBC9795616.1 TonB-dependent receptor plug domain-containing protein [Sinomicrobium weinanense]MBU3124637.1 TonB-dependent receptor plug domain-containing protein [Sinomicrobium weinanense]